jgi:anti-sigma B factor antagonist
MTVSERLVGAIMVLELDGQLTLGASAEGLRDKVRSLLQQGQRQFIMNLAAVPYMDSGGLGELVQSYATVTKQGGALKLLSQSPPRPPRNPVAMTSTATTARPRRSLRRRRSGQPCVRPVHRVVEDGRILSVGESHPLVLFDPW